MASCRSSAEIGGRERKEGDRSKRRVHISIVCYASKESELRETLSSLVTSCNEALNKGAIDFIDVVLVDNGPSANEVEKLQRLVRACDAGATTGLALTISGDAVNRGFGGGHNLTLSSTSDFHLILNPDVEIAANALCEALQFMSNNDACGLLAPSIFDGNGNREYLCKRYPSVFDLLIRGFAPRWMRGFFADRLARYEMRDLIGDEVVWSPPIVSGCFMLIRTSILKKLNGFDPAYFLYFEDFDLSLRAARECKIAYVPSVKIIHHGGYAASKGWRHIVMFVRSAVTFFNRHGWKIY